jgi:hypothetical protein
MSFGINGLKARVLGSLQPNPIARCPSRVTVDIKPLGELELWNRPDPGAVAPWVQAAVALASILAVVVVATAAVVLWHLDGIDSGYDRTWFHRAPPVYMAFVLGLIFVPGGSVSRVVRLAIALPVVHAIALVVAMFWVPHLDLPRIARTVPLYDSIPVGWVFVGMLVLTVGIARLVARREWVQMMVMIALANLLLLGLWLPIAAGISSRHNYLGPWTPTLAYLKSTGGAASLLAFALGPPLLVATLYATLSVRAPAFMARLRNVMISGLILLLAGAVVARARGDGGAILIYDNFMHVVFAVLMVAIVSTVTLSVATWFSTRRTARKLASDARRATISDDDEGDVVACVQITSWLRGPRVWTRSFIARLGDAELLVPGGARLATPVPLISSAMRLGEAVVVLRRGDEVVLGGFEEREVGDDPFRTMRLTMPGAAGITIGTPQPVTTPLQSVGMMAWRPSVAYLLITIVVAVPVLVGLVSPAVR